MNARTQIGWFVAGLTAIGTYFYLAMADVPLPFILPLLAVVALAQWRLLGPASNQATNPE